MSEASSAKPKLWSHDTHLATVWFEQWTKTTARSFGVKPFDRAQSKCDKRPADDSMTSVTGIRREHFEQFTCMARQGPGLPREVLDDVARLEEDLPFDADDDDCCGSFALL